MAATPAVALSDIGHTTIRKLRTHIIPFVFVLFMINFVDRINIGFAAVTMNRKLAITSQQFGLLSGIFFWGYFIFEIPSNLLLHKLGARIWIARILVSWGIVAILTGFVRSATRGSHVSYSHSYLLRFGFLQVCVFMLSNRCASPDWSTVRVAARTPR
jgi:ACS family tartrate transporter-like MFS transporter